MGSTSTSDEGYNDGCSEVLQCINLWGPAGGLGQGMVGAQPTGPYDYKSVLPL